MNTASVFAAVRAVQRDELSEAQREALAQMLLAVQVATELDTKPGPEWRPAIAAFHQLLEASGRPGSGGARVVPLRPCPGPS